MADTKSCKPSVVAFPAFPVRVRPIPVAGSPLIVPATSTPNVAVKAGPMPELVPVAALSELTVNPVPEPYRCEAITRWLVASIRA